jgi:hypothetical protein
LACDGFEIVATSNPGGIKTASSHSEEELSCKHISLILVTSHLGNHRKHGRRQSKNIKWFLHARLPMEMEPVMIRHRETVHIYNKTILSM